MLLLLDETRRFVGPTASSPASVSTTSTPARGVFSAVEPALKLPLVVSAIVEQLGELQQG